MSLIFVIVPIDLQLGIRFNERLAGLIKFVLIETIFNWFIILLDLNLGFFFLRANIRHITTNGIVGRHCLTRLQLELLHPVGSLFQSGNFQVLLKYLDHVFQLLPQVLILAVKRFIIFLFIV